LPSETDIDFIIGAVESAKADALKNTVAKGGSYEKLFIHLATILEGLKEYKNKLARSPKATEQDKELIAIKDKLRALGTAHPYFIIDYLLASPKTSYPFLIPNYMSELEGKHLVHVRVPGSHEPDRMETIDTFMNLLTPGSYVFIYGLPPRKSLIGNWNPLYPSSPLCVKKHQIIHKVPRVKIPDDAPFDKDSIDLALPQDILLKEFRERESQGIWGCPLCGYIMDGDESCAHSTSLVPLSNPPRTYPLVQTYVNKAEDKQSIKISLPYPFDRLFREIILSRRFVVTRFIYGAERSFLGQLWRMYYEPLYGYDMETKGLEFSVSDGIITSLSNLPDHLDRNLAILYAIHALTSILRAYGGTVADARLLIGSIMGMMLRDQKAPSRSEDFFSFVRETSDDAGRVLDIFEAMVNTYYGQGRIPTCYGRVRNEIAEILGQLHGKLGDFHEFKREVFMHSLKHYVYISAMVTAGVGSDELGAMFEGNRISVFDDADMGNGCCETISEVIWVPHNERMAGIRRSSQEHALHMRAEDCMGVLEELLWGCESCRVGRVYYDLIKSHDIQDFEAWSRDPEKFKRAISRYPDALISPVYGMVKQPKYVHEVLKLVGNYDDVWLYQVFPEVLLVTRGDEIALPEEGKVERIVDAVSLCVDGCPNCIWLDKCGYGPFSSRFHVSRELVEHVFQDLLKEATIDVDTLEQGQASEASKRVISERGVVYIIGSTSNIARGLVLVSSILASGETMKPFISHARMEVDRYIVKLCAERGSDINGSNN